MFWCVGLGGLGLGRWGEEVPGRVLSRVRRRRKEGDREGGLLLF